MIKVLHILSTTSISRGDFMVVLNYYKNISKAQAIFDFAKLYNTNNEADEEIKNLGGKVFKLTCPSLLRGAKEFKKELNCILENNDYDIIHLHMPTFQKFVKQVIRNKKIKLIIHSHSTKLSDTFFRNLRNKLLVMGLNAGVDCRLACTELAGKKIFGKSFLNNANDRVLTNAINLDKFRYDEQRRKEQRKLLNIQDGEIAVCHVGRFSEVKNHVRLISIFNEMCKKHTNLKLFLIGEGALKEHIKGKTTKLKLDDKVVFLGNRNDVFDVMQAMDIFILPSLFEGLGIVLIEAQAAGLLCFASDACPKDVELTENILRIPLHSNDKYWAEVIMNKYSEGWNRDTFDEIEKGNYNIKKEANKLLDIYQKIMEKNN